MIYLVGAALVVRFLAELGRQLPECNGGFFY